MAFKEKMRAWINENAPILKQAYQNKYVEMVYDRFASYPPEQQKQFIYGGFFATLLIVSVVLLSNFWTLFEYKNRAANFRKTTQLLLEFRRHQEEKKAELRNLEQSGSLSGPGALKKAILEQGRLSTISPRMIQVEEPIADQKGDSQTQNSKPAKVRVQRINLTQLKSFLQNLEFGNPSLSVTSVRILADDKIKGYLNAEIGLSVYIFKSEEEG